MKEDVGHAAAGGGAEKASPALPENAEALSQWQLILRRFRKHRLALASLYLLGGLYLVAAFAGFFAPYSESSRNKEYIACPPQMLGFSLADGLYVENLHRERDPVSLKPYYISDKDDRISIGFLVKGEPYRLWGLIPMERHFIGVDYEEMGLSYGESERLPFFLAGTDRYGHDLFSRIIFGSRISLSLGLVSIVITFFLGVVIGGISGYLGGRTDNLIQRTIEIINSFPQLPLWMAFAAFMPRHWSSLQVYFAITVLLSLLNWTWLARVVRGKILSLREEDYAVAARLVGASHGRVIFRHLVPGFTSHIIVSLTLSVPGMILAETALSFLGLGLRPPIVSWGVLLQECQSLQVVSAYPWLLAPATMIIVTVLTFNFLGDGFRDAADPYSSR